MPQCEYDFLKMVIDTSGHAIHSVTLIFVMFSLILCTKEQVLPYGCMTVIFLIKEFK
ncbi:putative membrane protein [Pectobacterium atrosepticum SCRI1043]|uniref:Membrane protein n=1 Tax=Pectobacterium atrosepticum (strain SCRI 1043 / ATCC BAA-672) TaxID=218491 RepID=Q6D357_PECAS|nr:putative membrane protein [Pectobacterium atrosepticum SCRI1043]